MLIPVKQYNTKHHIVKQMLLYLDKIHDNNALK